MNRRRRLLSRTGLILVSALCLSAAASPLSASAAPTQVDSSFAKRLLRIEGSKGADRITVDCNGASRVEINGRVPKLFSGDPLPCARVSEIDVISGDGNDQIDLTGVGPEFGTASFAGFGAGTLTAVISGAGDDQIQCGSAFCFVPDAGAGRDRLRGGARRDILRGGSDNDRIAGLGGRDDLLGRGGNDYLDGGEGDDLVSGNGGDDRLYGQSGSDVIGGGAGADTLSGGPGNDRLLGGPGRDRISPGPGKNVVVQDPPARKAA